MCHFHVCYSFYPFLFWKISRLIFVYKSFYTLIKNVFIISRHSFKFYIFPFLKTQNTDFLFLHKFFPLYFLTFFLTKKIIFLFFFISISLSFLRQVIVSIRIFNIIHKSKSFLSTKKEQLQSSMSKEIMLISFITHSFIHLHAFRLKKNKFSKTEEVERCNALNYACHLESVFMIR